MDQSLSFLGTGDLVLLATITACLFLADAYLAVCQYFMIYRYIVSNIEPAFSYQYTYYDMEMSFVV